MEQGPGGVRARPRGPGPRARGPGFSAERLLLAAMLRSSAALERVLEKLVPDDFHAPLHREIFTAIQGAGHANDLEALAEQLSLDAVALLDELAATLESSESLDQPVEDSLVRIQERRLQDRNREIDRLITLATGSEKDALMAEKSRNTSELLQLHPVRHRQ
jgi:hypothetical protein